MRLRPGDFVWSTSMMMVGRLREIDETGAFVDFRLPPKGPGPGGTIVRIAGHADGTRFQTPSSLRMASERERREFFGHAKTEPLSDLLSGG